jgi:glycosyltransferase involved in cell wall biosynthesis
MKDIANVRLRIVHVAPYFEKGNPFGGPLTVAINLVQQLNLDDLDVILLAGSKSKDEDIQGTKSKLFKAHRIFLNGKITGLFSPLLILWIVRNRKSIQMIHIHLAREMNTMLAAVVAKFLGIPYVLQTHGMIRKAQNMTEKTFDRIFTRRVFQHSKAVLYLTSEEKLRLEEVVSKVQFIRFTNSVEIGQTAIDFSSKESEVIFVSRLHKNKQPLVFLEMALEISKNYPETKFTIIGPDGGELESVITRLKSKESNQIRYEGILNPNEIQNRLMRSKIFVLPTLGDVFPLALLEAMASGCAIVTTNACEISNIIAENSLGIVTSINQLEISSAVEWLLLNNSECSKMGESAREYAVLNFDIRRVSLRLQDQIYCISNKEA